MKYKFIWCDSYNAYYHADDKLTEGDNYENFEEIIKNGIENIKNKYPNTTILEEDLLGWVDCEHFIEFECELIYLKEKVLTLKEGIGRIFDVFTVLDENNNRILTEENFYEEE